MRSLTLQHISYFTAARYISEALFAVRGFLLARLFGPLTFSLWTEMRLSLTFLQFIRLGTNEAFMRDYPYYVGEGTPKLAEKIKQVVSGFNLMTGALVVVAGGVFLLIRHWAEPQPEIQPWALWLVVFFLNQIYWFVQSQLQSAKLFLEVSKLLAGFALVSTVGGVLAAYFFGLLGFLTMLAVSYAFIVLFVVGCGLKDLKPAWDISLVSQLIRSGLPIMAANALFILLLNIDKILIWLLMPSKELGIYAIQSYVTNFIMLAPGAVAIVLFPVVMERLGESKRSESIAIYLTRPTLLLAYIACPVLGILYFSIHLPIRWFLPEYVSAILPGQILILASFFVIVGRMPAAILVSLKRQNCLMLTSLLVVALTGLAAYLVIKVGKGSVGVAGCSALGFLLYASIITLFSCRAIKLSYKSIGVFLFKIVIPFLVALLSVAVIDRLIPCDPANWRLDAIQTSMKCLIFVIPTGTLFLVFRSQHAFLGWSLREVEKNIDR